MIGQRALHHHQQQQQLSMATTSGYGSIRAGLKGDVMGQQTNHHQVGDGGLRNAIEQQQQQHSLDETSSKHSSLPGSGDDNSTGSWSASNSLNGCGGGDNSRRAATAAAAAGTTGGRLSVVLPQSQKSLMTPTIITSEGGLPTPCQLYSSLIQFNGQEVGLFTGLPTGCTPTSADGLARAGINPFFLGVAPFSQHQQKTPTVEQQLQQNDLITTNNNNNINPMQTNSSDHHQQQQQQQASNESTGSAEERERRKQLSKLSIDQRLQAANVILTSPLSFLLSPEHEAWIRLGLQQPHPLAAAANHGGQPPTGCCSLAPQHQQHLHPNPHLHQATDLMQQQSSQATFAAQSPYHNQTAQDLTSSNQLVAANRLNVATAANACPQAAGPNSSSSNPQQQQQNLQQVPPIITGSGQFNNNNTCSLTSGYNSLVQQTTATSIVVPTITTSSPYAGQQQPSPQHSAANFHPFAAAPPQASPNPTVNPTAQAAADERTRSGERDRDAAAARAPGLMGPPVAHHHQQHHPQHQQSPSTVFLMSPHPLDPRFIELHHQQRQQSQLNLQGSGLHAIQQQQDGGARSIGFYEPQLQQLYLAQQQQQQQQEMYNRQHQQQQQQLHNSACFQQNTLPTYQLVPNELSQTRQHQQESLLNQQTVPTYHGNQLEADTQGSVIENGLTNSSSLAEHQATNHHNANYTDSSSSSTHSDGGSSSSSGSESSSSQSGRSSVSRDTNSIDLNVAPSSDGCSSTVFTDIAQAMITANTTTTTKQVATGVNRKSATNKNKTGDKTTGSGDVGGPEPPAADAVVVAKKKSKGGRKKKIVTHEELMARKNRSKERNRVAAKRCRQKRKQFLDELRGRIDNLSDSNKKLLRENNQLKSELEQLRKHQKT